MPVGGGIETPSTLWKDQGRYIPVAAAQAPPLQIGGRSPIDKLEDVGLVRHHHVIGMGETDHRIVPEHRGSDVDPVMVLMRASVRRFQSPINDRRRCVPPSNKFEHVVRDDIRARA